jgi:peptide deformylase
MIQPIMKDIEFLSRKSTPATNQDLKIAQDLKDTLSFYSDKCVGMAANMIGVSKRIIIFSVGPAQIVMFNPKIVKKSSPYKTEEGCLSLVGQRSCTRYEKITVEYQDETFKKKKQAYSGFVAQIIQHEIDHLEGIII